LFPDDFNRRDSPRVVLGMAVSYRFGGKITAALSLNISRSGLAIRTAAPPPRNTVLLMRFALPGLKKEMQAEGTVSWSVPKSGMGIRFTKVKATDQAVIDMFVDAHFFRSVKPGS
jgi:uncharacterized protein (TIGR02266 family)